MAGSMLGGDRGWRISAKVVKALAQSSINCVVQLGLSLKLSPVWGRTTLLDPIAISSLGSIFPSFFGVLVCPRLPYLPKLYRRVRAVFKYRTSTDCYLTAMVLSLSDIGLIRTRRHPYLTCCL